MYEITPQKSNKKAQYLSTILLISAFAAMVFSSASWLAYRSVMQIIALLAMAVAVMLMVRYNLSTYTYAIVTSEDGGYDLTVTEIKRKSRITVCRISLSGIESAVIVDASNKKEITERAKKYKRFNYCVDLNPERSVYLFAEECGERLALRLSFDQKLFDIISAAGKN